MGEATPDQQHQPEDDQPGTPVDGPSTLAEGRRMPAEGRRMPAEGLRLPAEGLRMPVDGPGEPDSGVSGGRVPDGGQTEGEHRYFRGVARVPLRSVAPEDDTGELPPDTTAPARPVARVSRYRWRTLRRGARWTVTGASFAVICWALWMATVREGDVLSRVLALAVVFAIGALVFGVSRLLGRVVLEGTLGRTRRSAWAAHLLTFLLLVSGGIAFLQQTWWVVDAWRWFSDQL